MGAGLTKATVLDFTDAGNWTTADDAVFDSDTLTVTDPEVLCPANKWNPAPGVNGDGDAVLADIEYTVRDADGNAIELEYGTLVYRYRAQATPPDGFAWQTGIPIVVDGMVYAHYQHGDPRDENDGMQFGTFGMSERVSSFILGQSARFSEFQLRKTDDGGCWRYREYVRVGPVWLWRTAFAVVAEEGSFGGSGTGEVHVSTAALDGDPPLLVVCNRDGGGDEYESPRVYYARAGSATLKDAHAVTFLSSLKALGSLALVLDESDDPDGELEGTCVVSYKLGTVIDSVWTWQASWTTPTDGDLSGITVANWDGMIVKIAVDNTANHTLRPRVRGVIITCTEGPTDMEVAMDTILENMQSVLNEDGTVSGYTGWFGAHKVFTAMAIPAASKCAIFLSPVSSSETPHDEALYTNDLDEVKWFDHYVDVWCAWRVDETSSELVIDTTGENLMTFTKDMVAVLRANKKLAGGAKIVDVTGWEYGIPLPCEDCFLVSNRVRVRVRSEHFEA